jgi:hypothetical protein
MFCKALCFVCGFPTRDSKCSGAQRDNVLRTSATKCAAFMTAKGWHVLAEVDTTLTGFSTKADGVHRHRKMRPLQDSASPHPYSRLCQEVVKPVSFQNQSENDPLLRGERLPDTHFSAADSRAEKSTV